MNKIQKLVARIFGIKTQKVVVKKTVLAVCDKPFNSEELRIISDFMQTKVGRHFCDYLLSQKFAAAGRSAGIMRNGDLWQGYAVGFAAAVDSILALRQSDVNDNSGDSGGVGLEELASKLDQTER